MAGLSEADSVELAGRLRPPMPPEQPHI